MFGRPSGDAHPRRMDVPVKAQRALEEMATNDAIESLALIHEQRVMDGSIVWTQITIARSGKIPSPRRRDECYDWWAEDAEEVGPSAVRCNSVDRRDRESVTPLSAYQAALTALYALVPVPGCLEHS